MSILAGLLLSAVGALHPDSLTTTRIDVDADGGVTIQQRGQVLSLLEVIPTLDADGDGRVSAAEFESRRADVLAYVLEHYELTRDGAALSLSPEDVVFYPPGEIGGPLDRMGTVDFRFRTSIEPERVPVDVKSTLFLETSPGHYDILEAHWMERPPERRVLSARQTEATIFDGRRGPAFFGLGVEHILTGWDHVAFVLLLVVSAGRIRGLVWTVTAFTLAHSVTLGLAALNVVDPAPLARFVEMGIALSIVWLAGDTLLTASSRRTRAPEAFIFGLIHGLGFASFLRASLLAAESRIVALATFNLGVEAGQLLVVIVAAGGLRLLPRRPDGPSTSESTLAPRPVRIAVAALILGLGLLWFFERW